MKDIKVGVEKMTRNHRKMIEQMGDSLLLSKHSIQLSALFLLLSGQRISNLSQGFINRVIRPKVYSTGAENLHHGVYPRPVDIKSVTMQFFKN